VKLIACEGGRKSNSGRAIPIPWVATQPVPDPSVMATLPSAAPLLVELLVGQVLGKRVSLAASMTGTSVAHLVS
jgi:hypothetical protein